MSQPWANPDPPATVMFAECVLRGRRFVPARFCAPLAGYTHSAFRRLVTELGGCGALWTEMLDGPQILSESFAASPWLRGDPQTGNLFFQLMVRPRDPLDRILNRLGEHGVNAVDLNLACSAPAIRAQAAGSALFENLSDLRAAIGEARRLWPGILTAKIRLGRRSPDWQSHFAERLHALEDAGVDAVILHPRFFQDKFKRRAQLELLPWAASLTRLPLIANGDLNGPEHVLALAEALRPAIAVMLGRMAVARPWIFAAWDHPVDVDPAKVWGKLYQYVIEDFPPAVARRRIQMFTKYFAANFAFGHRFYVAVSNAPSLEAIRSHADEFFARGPALLAHPSLALL